MRLNLHVADIAAAHHGAIIVDATKKGKLAPVRHRPPPLHAPHTTEPCHVDAHTSVRVRGDVCVGNRGMLGMLLVGDLFPTRDRLVVPSLSSCRMRTLMQA